MSSQQYGQLQPVQPALVWAGLMAAMVNIMILVALGSWAFSLARKAVKGEEVKRPF